MKSKQVYLESLIADFPLGGIDTGDNIGDLTVYEVFEKLLTGTLLSSTLTVEGFSNVTNIIFTGATVAELSPGEIRVIIDDSITESDPIFTASAAYGITNLQINHWDDAYSWGNHADGNYVVSTNTYDNPSWLNTLAYSKITSVPDFVLTSTKGSPNGVVPLNSSGLIDSTYLPSYVDDVIEVSNFASLPTTGEQGKIYVTVNNGNGYRWSGSMYVEIFNSGGGAGVGTLEEVLTLDNNTNGNNIIISTGDLIVFGDDNQIIEGAIGSLSFFVKDSATPTDFSSLVLNQASLGLSITRNSTDYTEIQLGGTVYSSTDDIFSIGLFATDGTLSQTFIIRPDGVRVNASTAPTLGWVLGHTSSGLDYIDPSTFGGGGSMVYPGAGIAVSDGSAWDTSIADNSADWNTAYGWGDHSVAGYLTTTSAASTYVSLSGSYIDPSWIVSLPFSKITGITRFAKASTVTPSTPTTGALKYNHSLLIPANTFTVGDLMRMVIRVVKTGITAGATINLYFNTSASLTGATQFANVTSGANTQTYFQFERHLAIVSPTSTKHAFLATTSQSSDTGAGALAAPSSINVNWTVDQYLVVGINLSNSSDTILTEFINIEI